MDNPMKFTALEVAWQEGMKSAWKSKVVKTEVELDKLLAKLENDGATNVSCRPADGK